MPSFSQASLLDQRILVYRNSGWVNVSFTEVFSQADLNNPNTQLWVAILTHANAIIPKGVCRRFNVIPVNSPENMNDLPLRVDPDSQKQQNPQTKKLFNSLGVQSFVFPSAYGEFGVQWTNFVSSSIRPQFQFNLEIDSNHPFFNKTGSLQIQIRTFWKGLTSLQHDSTIELLIIDHESNPDNMITNRAVAIDLGNFATAVAVVSDTGPVYPSLGVKQDEGVSASNNNSLMVIFRSGLSLARVYGNSISNQANEKWFGIHRGENITGDIDHRKKDAVEIDYYGRSIQCHDVKRLLASGNAEYDLDENNSCFDDLGNFDVSKRKHFMNLTDSQNNAFFTPKRIPAELFLTRIFDHLSSIGFDAGRLGMPREIILTYPTSYTTREIVQLSRAVHRAWLRHADLLSIDRVQNSTVQVNRELIDRIHDYVNGTALFPLETGTKYNTKVNYGPLVPEVVDEATASGIYFIVQKLIYNDNFKQLGPIDVFRFRYPKGVRLVVVDIGAGTSDVATLHAELSEDSNDKNLKVRLINKSGSRRFSGDMITAAIAKIIKAKLILASIHSVAAPNRELTVNTFKEELRKRNIQPAVINRYFSIANDNTVARVGNPEEGNDFIGFVHGVINVFGSQFNQNTFTTLMPWVDSRRNSDDRTQNPGMLDSALRHESLDWLVSVSEKAKVDLSNNPANDRWTLGPSDYPERVVLNRTFSSAISGKLVSVFRAEVDAFIRPELLKFASLVNQFLFYQSGNDLCSFIQSSDWLPPKKVVLAGRASLYPLIRETLSKNLCLMDPDQSLVHMHQNLQWQNSVNRDGVTDKNYNDPEELKVCVTKGALMLSGRGNHGLKIRIISKLDMCLPYRVYVQNGGQSELVFHTAQAFSTISNVANFKRFQALTPIQSGMPVLLQYQMPGESEFIDLSRHYFQGQDNVSVFFIGCDETKRRCVVYPGNNRNEPDLRRPAREEPASNKEYESPLHAGDI